MTIPKRLIAGLMLAVFAALTGCTGHSFGFSSAERAHTYKSISSSEWRMAKDDFDNFWMMDRRSRLTRWH